MAGWMTFEQVISSAQSVLRDDSGNEIPPGILKGWAEEANREFARRTESVFKEDRRTLLKGVREYTLPADCIRPTRVYYRLVGYEFLSKLEFIELQRIIRDDAVVGPPGGWYITGDRQRIGLDLVPDQGGVDGTVTGIVDAGSFVSTDLGDTDDEGVDSRIRFNSGANIGLTRTISSYDAATHTLSVSTDWPNVPQVGDTFSTHAESLIIPYIATGNSYKVLITDATVGTGSTRTAIVCGLPAAVADYYKGCHVEFMSGSLRGLETRVASSWWDGSATSLEVPDMGSAPASSDTMKVADVPNIPPAFHGGLVEYLLWKANLRRNLAEAQIHRGQFEQSIAACKTAKSPDQGQVFHQIRESRSGDLQGWI